MLVALAGGVAAIGIATAIGGIVHRVLVPGADWSGGIVDTRVLTFTLVATLVIGVLLGVAPAAARRLARMSSTRSSRVLATAADIGRQRGAR